MSIFVAVLIAVGLFARLDRPVMNVLYDALPAAAPPAAGQFLAQLVGVATLLGFILPLTYALHWLLNLISPFRATIEGERQGMDLYELGAGAYPEFVTHTEDFTPR